MTNRTASIRLSELQSNYYTQLSTMAYRLYDELLHNRAVIPEELDEEIRAYYRRTTASLQEYYSRYVAQWEVYQEAEIASNARFLTLLKQSAYLLSMRYSRVDLNTSYYLEQFSILKPRSKAFASLRDCFLNQWHGLLSNNEFHYQMEHINRLVGLFSGELRAFTDSLPVRGNTRLLWLLRNHKQLVEQMLEYDETMRTHPVIRELIDLLGKKHEGREKRFQPTAGIRKEHLVTHAAKSDITGISVGDDLSSLLPLEYCFLADAQLQPIFYKRFTEKKLQQIDYASRELRLLNDEKRPGREISEELEGPFIVCMDTSGSMAGERERTAKSILLAIAELTEKQHRKCYIILFSDEVECIEIESLGKSFERLVDFLSQSFHSGSDLLPAIDHCIRLIEKGGYSDADLVWISDFEMPALELEQLQGIARIKAKQTHLYALSMGQEAEQSYLDVCTRYWKGVETNTH